MLICGQSRSTRSCPSNLGGSGVASMLRLLSHDRLSGVVVQRRSRTATPDWIAKSLMDLIRPSQLRRTTDRLGDCDQWSGRVKISELDAEASRADDDSTSTWSPGRIGCRYRRLATRKVMGIRGECGVAFEVLMLAGQV